MNFEAVKDSILAAAEALGIEEYDVFFMESESASTETLKDEISSFSFGVVGGVGFRCIVNGHMGCAATELLTEEEMKRIVSVAAENAKSLENEDEPMIFKGSEAYGKVTIPPYARPSTARMKEIALTLQAKTYQESDYIADGTQSGVFAERTRMHFLNSCGLSLSHEMGADGAFVQAVVAKDGESQADFDFTLGLENIENASLSETVTKKALEKIGAVEIDSGKYDVIFSGRQMCAMLSAFSSVFSAKNAQLGLSLLKGKEGQCIAAKGLCLVDDPFRADSSMQMPFDGEGVATYRKKVIENGVLNTLLYDLATAKKEGKSSTGNGQRASYADAVTIRPYSFYFEAGTNSEEALFEKMGDGLYITELKGLHAGANAVTGDFSIESAGFRVRNGQKAEAVRSFTIAGNFFELLQIVEELGDTVHFGMPGITVYGSPDVLVRNMSIAGK